MKQIWATQPFVLIKPTQQDDVAQIHFS